MYYKVKTCYKFLIDDSKIIILTVMTQHCYNHCRNLQYIEKCVNETELFLVGFMMYRGHSGINDNDSIKLYS